MTASVFVYQLFEADALDTRSERLAGYFAAAGPGRPIDPSFTAMPDGCFRYVDRGRFSRAERPDLLPRDAESARKAAVAFMRAVNEIAARDGGGSDPKPFPVDALLQGGARRVKAQREKTDDHWLTSWGIQLRASPDPRERPVPVLGATIEIRVGAMGQVVGVVSRARPWKAAGTRPRYTWNPDADEHEHQHDDGHEHDEPDAGAPVSQPPLVYLCDNPGEPQRFFSPCFVVPPHDEEHGHGDRRLFPACDHTVLPEITVRERSNEATALAILPNARGTVDLVEHGRDWSVTWSIATLADFVSGERKTSVGTSLQLPGPGLFQVELLVENRSNGALRSTHRQIAFAATEESETTERLA